MFTWVASDDNGKLSKSAQRRVRSYITRSRIRKQPGPHADAADGRTVSTRPRPIQPHTFPVRLASTRNGCNQDEEDVAQVLAPTATNTVRSTLHHQPFYVPPFALPVDERSIFLFSSSSYSASPIPCPGFHFQCFGNTNITFTVQHACPLGTCSLKLSNLEHDVKTSHWREWLTDDVAYTHSSMALSCALQDFLQGRKDSRTAIVHLTLAIRHLNQKLSNPNLALGNSTVATIINLTAATAIASSYETASAHVSGLRRIVELRGGLDDLQADSHTIATISRSVFSTCPAPPTTHHVHTDMSLAYSRLDLQLSLDCEQSKVTGNYPYLGFLLSTKSQPLPSSFIRSPNLNHERHIYELVDHSVARIFHDLQILSRKINKGVASSEALPVSDIYDELLAAQQSLIHLPLPADAVLDECVRLTLLSFLSTLWATSGKRRRSNYALNHIHRLSREMPLSSPPLRELMLWILMVGMVSTVLGPEDEWLRACWHDDLAELTRYAQWPSMRRRFQGYLWIDERHDLFGRRYFEELAGMA